MQKRCYYEILSLTREADAREVKAAYRRLALEYHPDRNSSHDAEEKFKEASEAYEVLSDAEKRAVYDRYGHRGLDQQGFHGFSGSGDIFSHFSDLFEDFFGMGQSSTSQRRQRGSDLRFDLSLTFQEAYEGIKKNIEIQRHEACADCHGLGYPENVKPQVCPHCRGQGQVYQSQGFFTISSTCRSCGGQGKVVGEHCSTCRGQGSVPRAKKLEVKIPAGVDDGMRLRVSGEGEPGHQGGNPGDLYVFLQVQAHPRFKRQGNDLLLEQDLSLTQAALGAEIEVETPQGFQKIEVPAGTQTGESHKIPHLGMADVQRKGRGDLWIHFFVKTPKKLSPAQRELLEKFRELSHEEGGLPQPEKIPAGKSKKKSKKSKIASWF